MSKARWMRDAGLGLIITPTIMFGILIWGAVSESRLLSEHWDVYVPFVVLPYAAGVALLLYARKVSRAA